MRNKTFDLYIKLLLLFPIFTVIQALPLLGTANKILFAVVLLLQIVIQFFQRKIKVKRLLIYFIVIVLEVYSIVVTDFPLYNMNLIFYFPFWIIFLFFYLDEQKMFKESLIRNKNYIYKIILIWTVIVLVSFVFPSSYIVTEEWGNSRYFISFSGNAFRIASSSLLILSLLFLYYRLSGKKNVLVFALIPLLCFFICGSRTYLGIGILTFLLLWYYYCKNKSVFWASLVPFTLVFVIMLLNSSMYDKIISTLYDQNSYFDILGTLTNSRSVFWPITLYHFSLENIFNQLLGCGFDFVYEVTEKYFGAARWAHNDFIGVLLNYGYLGLIVYCYSIYCMLSNAYKKSNKKVGTVVLLIWLINAMFNMFYTYFCSVIAMIVVLSALNINKRDLDKKAMPTLLNLR